MSREIKRKEILKQIELENSTDMPDSETGIYKFMSGKNYRETATVHILHFYLVDKGVKVTRSYFAGAGDLLDRVWGLIERHKDQH
ncbi:MAG: hypothetical protein CMF12_01185 [Idiomarina sp.]|uniref:hypothetical protein n=1 Tax=Idiomarina sp. TaxID=1874361 RepID=UPI000C481B30|nr:hypothetical protein [Idiomarina sp.]MBT41114.1 hypothetical protein [Idiomarina sp.]